jgi:hypothetical protein
MKIKLSLAAIAAALIPLAAVMPGASASSVTPVTAPAVVNCADTSAFYLYNHHNPNLYLQTSTVGGANNEAVFGQTFSFMPIPLQFCLKSAPNGNKYVYSDGTSLCLNWDQSAGHVRLLNCSAIASDEWFIAAPLGDSGPIGSVYNEADCLQVTAVNADATIAECTGTADQTFTLDPL